MGMSAGFRDTAKKSAGHLPINRLQKRTRSAKATNGLETKGVSAGVHAKNPARLAHTDEFVYVGRFYKSTGRHSALACVSPILFEWTQKNRCL